MASRVKYTDNSFSDFVMALEGAESSASSYHNLDVVKRCRIRGQFSPDFYELRKFDLIPFFFYDHKLHRGGMDTDILRHKDTQYLGEAYSMTPRYTLQETYDTVKQAAFDDKTMSMVNKGFLFGEVFAVPPKVLLDLDVFHRNGLWFERKRRNVLLVDQETPFVSKFKGVSLPCWTYLGREEFFRDIKMRIRSRIKHKDVDKLCYLS